MPIRQGLLFRKLLPVAAVASFVTMVAIGVRSSPKWPPPARHEPGGWEIEDPPALTWAAFINLPATIPILLLWAHNNAFAYAFDDHDLSVYVPWIFLVGYLWSFVGYRVDQFIRMKRWTSSTQRHLVIFGQTLVSAELFYAVLVMRPGLREGDGMASVLLTWTWVLLTAFGWLDLIAKKEVRTAL